MSARSDSKPRRRPGPSGREEAGVVSWNLRLYVAGQTPRSRAALANLEKICRDHLPPGGKVEVIDLVEKPHLAREDQILAIPTLVRKLPSPVRKIICDLSNTERVLAGLEWSAPEQEIVS